MRIIYVNAEMPEKFAAIGGILDTDIFISYKREDGPFVDELHQRLVDKGRIVKIDKNIPYGREWRAEIDQWLDNAALIVLVISELSMQSAYVTYEWCYSLFKHDKDFHLIKIEHCDKDKGMFGLLMDSRNAPFECNRTPTEDEWQKVVNSVEERLVGWTELREAGKILTTLGLKDEQKPEAATKLGQVRDKYHISFARGYLQEGLIVHTYTYGTVQRAIVAAIEVIGGDARTIPYLIKFCSEPHEPDISERAERLIKILAERNS